MNFQYSCMNKLPFECLNQQRSLHRKNAVGIVLSLHFFLGRALDFQISSFSSLTAINFAFVRWYDLFNCLRGTKNETR
jgi:hypothetical protein